MSGGKINNISKLTFPWLTKDPFLFCAHHEDYYPPGNDELGPAAELKGRNIGNDFVIKDGYRMYHGDKVPGFPSHPHCGFETVTICRRGYVDHSDSLGAAGRFGQGDVQWMTAGKGVQHSEMFPLLNRDKGNELEMFQIWLNLPRSHKKVNPYFSMMWSENIPVVEQQDEAGRKTEIKIVAGKLAGISAVNAPPSSWAADPANEVNIWNIKLQKESNFIIPAASAGLSRILYFFKGDFIMVNGIRVGFYHSVELNPDEDIEITNGNSESELLLLQGKPINEPVFQYGPFVVNDEHEIRQVMMEYGKSMFGGWPWPRHDNVHDKSKKRFALYADGKLEERPI